MQYVSRADILIVVFVERGSPQRWTTSSSFMPMRTWEALEVLWLKARLMRSISDWTACSCLAIWEYLDLSPESSWP